jgi:hypothetical protein
MGSHNIATLPALAATRDCSRILARRLGDRRGPALSSRRHRRVVERVGVWGFAALVVAFSVGQLLRVPGPVFVAAAILVYGKSMGTVAAIIGALVSVNVSVIIVRAIAGQPLATVERPVLRRLFRGIDQRPVLVVATMRLIFQTAPVLNYSSGHDRGWTRCFGASQGQSRGQFSHVCVLSNK